LVSAFCDTVMKGLGTSSAATNDDNVTNGSNNHLARRLLSSCLANVRAIAMLHLQVKRCLLCVHVSHVLCVYVSHEFLIMFYRMPHHCCCQNPSTTDLDLTIANLFKLSDSLGACSPSLQQMGLDGLLHLQSFLFSVQPLVPEPHSMFPPVPQSGEPMWYLR